MKKIFHYLLLTCTLLMLVACGKPESQKAFEEKFKEFNSLIVGRMQDADEGTRKMAEIISKTTYKVNKVDEKGDSSELNVTIKAVNLGKYINEYIAAVTDKFGANAQPDEKELNDFSVGFFSKVAEDKNLEYTETVVDVQMQKVNGEWQIINGNELILAILGGVGNNALGL